MSVLSDMPANLVAQRGSLEEALSQIDWAPYQETADGDLPLSEELLEQYLTIIRPYLEAEPAPLNVEENPCPVEIPPDCSAPGDGQWLAYVRVPRV